MRTAIIGGGQGCRAILELLAAGHLRELQMDVVGVADPDPAAPGRAWAAAHGLAVLDSHLEALDLPGLETVVELTGRDDILAEIYHALPAGLRVIDHATARVFWDVMTMERRLREELRLRAELEDQLAADRARAQHLLDALPDVVVVLDDNKRILQANARFGDACSRPLEEIIGRPCNEIFCSAEREPHRSCPFEQALASARPVAAVVERRQGDHLYWEVTACPQYDEFGALVEMVETHHPITKRVLLQREAEARERRLRQFVDSAHDIISMKDRDGRYTVYNPATAALFGRDPSEFIGRTAEEIYEPDIARMIVEHDRQVMERREHVTYEEHFVIDGREYDLHTVRFPLFDYRGEVEGVATIARDVTRERALQRQLLQSTKLAAVGKLAAGVAHEINNPLTGVLAYAEDLLEDAAPDDPRRADYQVIVRETLRCREIVRGLLDFARQEEPRLEPVDLNEVARRTLSLVERLPRFHDIRMQRRLKREPLPVTADSRQLQQVLLNLIINASDAAGGRGRIVVASGRRRGDGRCWLGVRDSGPGVAAELRERIFEPFFSTKATAGLGLSVSWGIVERHGGVIEVDDAPDGGAEFRVILPPAGPDAAGPPGAEPPGPDPAGRPGTEERT